MKYYKVIKENFLWEVGAILKHDNGYGIRGGYSPVDDVFCKHDVQGEYISSPIVENEPDYFQRVYAISLVTKVVYKTKEQAKEHLQKMYKEEK